MSDPNHQSPSSSGPDRVIFLHIVKTAGTSLVEYLRRRLPAGTVLSHGDFLQFEDERLLPATVAGCRLLSGHFGYTHIRDYLADSYSVTFLRDPIARVLSFYKYCQHADMQRRFPVARSAAELSVDDFMTSTRPEVVEVLDNQQTWQLADMYWTANRQRHSGLGELELLDLARQHLGEFSLVGSTETFAADFRELVRVMQLPEPTRIPQQLRTDNPVAVEQLLPSTLATLQARMALDFELCEFARGLRAQN